MGLATPTVTHEKALSILVENAGIQFDPEIVATFLMLPREILAGRPILESSTDNMRQLEEALVG